MLPDVVIVGGGVIGLSAAWRLAQAGLRVRVLDRGQVGREASWAGAGIIDPGSVARTDALAQLRRRSAATYPDFVAEIQDRSGIDLEYLRCGGLDLIEDDNQERAAEREVAAASGTARTGGEPAGSPGAPVTPAQLAWGGEPGPRHALRLEPRVQRWSAQQMCAAEAALSPRLRGCLWKRDLAQVRNPRLMAGLAAVCRNVGVRIDEGVEVREVALDGGRAVIECVAAGRVSAGEIVLAAGAWTSQIAGLVQRGVAVHPVRGQIVLLDGAPALLRHVIQSGKRYLVPRIDGKILVGSTEEPEAGFEKRNTVEGVEALLGFALRVAPGLRGATPAGAWSGLRPGTADGRPYIGRAPGFGNLIVAAGHFRSGVVLAPATGELVAQLALGSCPDEALSGFAVDRCVTGSGAAAAPAQ